MASGDGDAARAAFERGAAVTPPYPPVFEAWAALEMSAGREGRAREIAAGAAAARGVPVAGLVLYTDKRGRQLSLHVSYPTLHAPVLSMPPFSTFCSEASVDTPWDGVDVVDTTSLNTHRGRGFRPYIQEADTYTEAVERGRELVGREPMGKEVRAGPVEGGGSGRAGMGGAANEAGAGARAVREVRSGAEAGAGAEARTGAGARAHVVGSSTDDGEPTQL
jgi:hypothetical protein